MNYRALALMVAAGVMSVGVQAMAQPGAKEAPKAGDMARPATDADIAAVTAALTGSWKTTTQVDNAGPNGTSADLIMSVAPVTIPGVPNALYAELCQADSLNRPYRQAIWQLHRIGGKLRLKTLEFRRVRAALDSADGTWAAPETFPSITMDDLVATLDIELAKVGSDWKGRTAHPFPTAASGAVEMTSEVTISPDTFTTADKGMDAQGKVVWGPPASSPQGYSFKKFDTGVKVERLEGGVVVIAYPSKGGGAVAKQGDKIVVNYSGYLSNGWLFDSSYERGVPFSYIVGGKYVHVCEGWKRGMEGVTKGSARRIVIPGPLGFGSSGELDGKIPANATLYMDVDVVDVAGGGMAAAPQQGGVPVGVQPADPNSKEFKDMQEKLRQKQEAATQQTSDHPASSPK